MKRNKREMYLPQVFDNQLLILFIVHHLSFIITYVSYLAICYKIDPIIIFCLHKTLINSDKMRYRA